MGKKKISSCSRCRYIDENNYCRVGRGWLYIKNPETSTCEDQYPLLPSRCGRCKWFSMVDGKRDTSYCFLWRAFYNFYDKCPEFREEESKDLRPNPDTPPSRLWQL